MTSTTLLTKSRLTKLFGRRTSDGYVELVAATDRGFFDLRRTEVAFRGSDAGPTSDFEDWLDESFRSRLIEEVWTDGDSLYLLMGPEHGIIYEFTLPDATAGSKESVTFVRGRAEVSRIRESIAGDSDSRLL